MGRLAIGERVDAHFLGSSGIRVDVHERLSGKALLAASPFRLAGVKGSGGGSLCRSCLKHREHFLFPRVVGRVDETRMALALLVRGGRCAPLSTKFGRWIRYWWIALCLSTLQICRPPKKSMAERCCGGSREAATDLPDEPIPVGTLCSCTAPARDTSGAATTVSRRMPSVFGWR